MYLGKLGVAAEGRFFSAVVEVALFREHLVSVFEPEVLPSWSNEGLVDESRGFVSQLQVFGGKRRG